MLLRGHGCRVLHFRRTCTTYCLTHATERFPSPKNSRQKYAFNLFLTPSPQQVCYIYHNLCFTFRCEHCVLCWVKSSEAVYHEHFDKNLIVQGQRWHRGPSVLKGSVLVKRHGHRKVAVLCVQSDGSVETTEKITTLLAFMVLSSNKLSDLPDIHPDHVLAVGLLDQVVDGVAAHEGDVDVVPRYHVCVVVVYGVYEHDVCVVRGLRKESKKVIKNLLKWQNSRPVSHPPTQRFCPDDADGAIKTRTGEKVVSTVCPGRC